MAKRVVVTSAQRSAARAMVEWSAHTGRPVSDAVRKIAEAKPMKASLYGVAPAGPSAPPSA